LIETGSCRKDLSFLFNEQREPKVSEDENNCGNKEGSHQDEEILHDIVQDINMSS
jgi:hypothetical protein